MSNFIYTEYSQADRVKMLKNLCVTSQVKTYNRSISQEEVDNETANYASNAIELVRQKAEMKAEVERMKAGISSMEALMEGQLEIIRTGQKEATATLYGVPDYNKNMMNWYDAYGERINSLPLTPEQRQGRMFIGADPDAPVILPYQTAENENAGITDIEFENEPGTTDYNGDVTEEPAIAPETQKGIDMENAAIDVLASGVNQEPDTTAQDNTAEGFINALEVADETFKNSVDELYATPEATGNVEIPITPPNEVKPAKARKTAKKAKGKDQDPI